MDRNHDGLHKPLTLVPEAGVEPAWTFWVRGILSPLRLPIPPLRQAYVFAGFATAVSAG